MATSAMAVLYLALVVFAAVATAQTIPPCATNLMSCSSFLTDTKSKPDSTCCTPLKQAVQTQFSCLCTVFNNEQLLQMAGVNKTVALTLPSRCGITTDFATCSTAGGAPNSAPSPAGSKAPAASPSGTAGSNSTGVAYQIEKPWLVTVGLLFVALVVLRTN